MALRDRLARMERRLPATQKDRDDMLRITPDSPLWIPDEIIFEACADVADQETLHEVPELLVVDPDGDLLDDDQQEVLNQALEGITVRLEEQEEAGLWPEL